MLQGSPILQSIAEANVEIKEGTGSVVDKNQQRDMYGFWAKLPRDERPPTRYHPVLCHLIDVASVTEALWKEVLTPAARSGVACGLGMEEGAAGRWVAYLAGLHDIGKVSPAFQLQVDFPVVRTWLGAAGFSEAQLQKPHKNTPHGMTSAIALREEILCAPPYALAGRVLADLATLVGGHHGLFASLQTLDGEPGASTGRAVRGMDRGRWRGSGWRRYWPSCWRCRRIGCRSRSTTPPRCSWPG